LQLDPLLKYRYGSFIGRRGGDTVIASPMHGMPLAAADVHQTEF